MKAAFKLSPGKLTIAWLFILPVLLIRAFTTLYPTVVTFVSSLFEINIFKGGDWTFIGFDNFVTVLQDEKVLTSIKFTLIFTSVSMAFHIIFGIFVAMLLNVRFKGKKFLRTVTLIPWAMPMIVTGLASKWAFNNTYGLINDLIRRFNPDFQFDWLIYPASARLAVIMVDLWKDVPFFAILLLAGLQFIPDEIYESAKIDGAGAVKSFWAITMPLLMRTLLTLCIFFTLWRIVSYDIVYAMTTGGPGDATSLLAYRISVEAFTNLNIGYASAIAVCLFLIMVVFSSLNLVAIKRTEH
ncbi:carbohydrate ABC transporter permease [Paenibacillus piri]|uniref:Sugar ABC transporter permease n=1 Tax=Paenibacillus piri TaxID=2547395 RepID=A0A4R5KSK8_9BACL|nr:sugar ABC transporter permease [Paenibacillus piri]TDF98781.1 sugar ABC transporter permease [Paenibacillus piri]